MLRIRSDQQQAFADVARASFEGRLVTHVKKCFPEEAAALGDNRVREIVRQGIERAVAYGFEAEMLVCQYVDLVFALGEHFDENPALPWARQILAESPRADPFTRMERLYERALGAAAGTSW